MHFLRRILTLAMLPGDEEGYKLLRTFSDFGCQFSWTGRSAVGFFGKGSKISEWEYSYLGPSWEWSFLKNIKKTVQNNGKENADFPREQIFV